jgi:tryptophanyl-tRNA synthetase
MFQVARRLLAVPRVDNADIERANKIPLANWIADYLAADKRKVVYDFGCGTGAYLRHLAQNGFPNLCGFEGGVPSNSVFDGIFQADLTKPMSIATPGNCLFLEVAEHIPAQYEDIVLDNVTRACSGHFIASWGVPGQLGDGHVNCRSNLDAIDRFAKRGLRFNEKASLSARNVITDLPWFKNTLLVFDR